MMLTQIIMMLMAITMIMETNVCSIINPLVIGIVSGIASSLLAWIVLNVWFTSRLKTDDQIQYSKKKMFIRVYNKSWINVFEVTCRIKYIYSDGDVFFRTDQTIPFLERRTGEYNVVLNGNSGKPIPSSKNRKTDAVNNERNIESNNTMPVEKFFLQSTGTIILTITYQNRFGIKSTLPPIKLKYSKEPAEEA